MGSKLLPNVWGLLASLLCGCWPNDPLRAFSVFDELGVAEEMSSNSVQRYEAWSVGEKDGLDV